MKPTPVVSRVMQHVKRPSKEKLIVPKKKPLIISCVKNPVILPKSDSTANTITLHGVDTIKTIPTISIVSPIVTQTCATKQIFSFVHSDITKVSFIPDHHITVDETLEQNVVTENNDT